MACCVLFTPKREEGQQLLEALHDRAAYLTEQALDCRIFCSARDAAGQLCRHRAEAIVWDVSREDALPVLAEVRQGSRDAFLLILARPDTSPLIFLRPDILPSSLILRPLGPSEVDRVVCEMLRSICGDKDGCFVVERRGERQQIPWEQIYYFESRERKIFVRLRGEEVGFSGTLDGLEGNLPGYFQRCHRSFIVNMEKVDKVRLGSNLIVLWDGLSVPLSRGYKQSVKERASGRA